MEGAEAVHRVHRQRLEAVTLFDALQDHARRDEIAADAVAEAAKAVGERPGFGGISAQLGLDSINRLRPGFLQRHIHAMLPAMALAVEPHWKTGVALGDPGAHLNDSSTEVTAALLGVADAYVAQASDAKAIAVYEHLRQRAPRRIEEQMPRIARFIARHTPPSAAG